MNVERIRKDFPILKRNMIYFDNACNTFRPNQVIEAINTYYKEFPGCGGRSSHFIGREVTKRYEETRKIVAKFIGAKPKEIIFTQNTTEGINLIARSFPIKKGEKVLTTDKEHNSNLVPWKILEKKKGIRHIILKSNPDNTFNLENFEKLMKKEKIKLVSIVHISNLDGIINPIKEIVEIAHEHDAKVLVDGAQSVGHIPINVKKLDIDFLAFSGHKMLGPSGVGVLYGKYELLEELDTFIVGGDTVENTTYKDVKFLEPPHKFEAGLRNYAGVIGLGEAIKYLDKIGMKNVEKYIEKLTSQLLEAVDLPDISVIGNKDPKRRSGVVSFNVKSMNHHEVGSMLEGLGNILVRTGMLCVHSWFNAHNIKGCVRASVYIYNTEKEIEKFRKVLKEIISLR